MKPMFYNLIIIIAIKEVSSMKNKTILVLLLILLLISVNFYGKEFKVAVKQLPTTDLYMNILKAFEKASGNTFSIQAYPPARADYLVSNGEVDIQLPIIIIPDAAKHKDLKYDFSSAVLYKLAFVLYTNKNKAIDIDSLKKVNPNKYKIEIDPSRGDDYNYAVTPSTNFEASFKKLDSGAIDGLIISQTSGDKLLKDLGLKSIKRQLWFEYDLTFSLKKGEKGGETDKMLVESLKKLKASGEFDKVAAPLMNSAKYNNWQP